MAIATDSPAAPAAGIAAGTAGPAQRYYRRFTAPQRVMHAGLMLTFVGCALTGLPLLYSSKPWAVTLAHIFGGFEAAGTIHRICASVMIIVFSSHVILLLSKAMARGGVLPLLWGPDSLVPQPQDIVDIVRNFKWFVGAGPQPQFDRWTYWEKFDYWAVFWGMFIIGGSGLLLWFPEFFAGWLPGWIYNVALMIHGEEALLATGFIFTIHFFNSHFRPEKFPMDMVMFTGQVTEDELKHERPGEYAQLVAEGRLDAKRVPEEPAWVTTGGKVLGWAAVGVGLVLLVFILGGVLNG